MSNNDYLRRNLHIEGFSRIGMCYNGHWPIAITNKSEIEELLRIGLCYDGPWLIATTITTAYYRLLNKL